MMAIQGMGRLVADPVVEKIGENQLVTVRLASARYDPKADNNKGTDFIDAKMWGKRGTALAEYTTKGSLLFISGELEIEQWEGKDGGKRTKAVIRLRDFEFASKKPTTQGTANSASDADPF